jgi:hypothetical protein
MMVCIGDPHTTNARTWKARLGERRDSSILTKCQDAGANAWPRMDWLVRREAMDGGEGGSEGGQRSVAA